MRKPRNVKARKSRTGSKGRKAAPRRPAAPARPSSRGKASSRARAKSSTRKARPASRRSEPVLAARSAGSPVKAVPPAAVSTGVSTGVDTGVVGPLAASMPRKPNPAFPEDHYDYTYLHDFLALDIVPRHCRAVVFGCGKGEEAVFLSERGYRVTALGSDRNDIGLARERAWLNNRDIDFMIGDVYDSSNLLPAESFGLATDRGFFRSLPGERERRLFLELVRRLLLPGGIFLLNAADVVVGRKAPTPRRRGRGQNDLLVQEGGVVMGEVIRSGLEIVGRRHYPVQDPAAGKAGRSHLLLCCRK